ncbi:MAG: penicillin-binding protein [Bacteroidales bacterium]|nr:penicillin-binding protein [Bacteroidales bacterium]
MRKGFLPLVFVVIVITFIACVGKILYIEYAEYHEWKEAGKRYIATCKELPAQRGDIISADGQILATSMPHYKLKMDMRTDYLNEKNGKHFFDNVDSLAICLSKFFHDRSVAEYRQYLVAGFNNKKAELPLSNRAVSYIEMKEVKTWPLFRLPSYQSGLLTKEINIRINPFNPLAKRTIGTMYKDMEKGGSAGVELAFDSLLCGKPGMMHANKMIAYHPQKGVDVVMTLDMSIQEYASQALRDGMIEAGADKGCLVLMETATGDIKACANLTRINDSLIESQNIALTELMPPGSTFKTVSMLVALEDGAVHPNDVVNTGMGSYNLHGHTIRDSHAVGEVTAEEVIATSSNVGTAILIDNAYHDRPGYYVELIRKTKLQEPMVNIGINGVGKVDIRSPKDPNDKRYWSNFSLGVMSFGYETTVPPIYMLRFYNAIANNGVMVDPKFVKELRREGKTIKTFETNVVNPAICSEQTLQQITKMLKMVVNDKHGTGYGLVRSPYVEIAGKTGTATDQRKGYTGNYASFCGFFPADKPQYTMYVMMHGGRIFGNQSGKVFRQVAENVYAEHGGHKHISQVHDTIHSSTPNVKGGLYLSTRNVLKELDINNNQDSIKENQAWTKARTDSTGLQLYSYDWQDDLVPNVVGMTAKDAVYMLENSGMRVVINGFGSVATQSISAGTKIKQGETISLTLKNKS